MASRTIRVIDISEAQIVDDDKLVSRRLVRREHGSPDMSFNVSTLHEGFYDAAALYPEHDEIVYILSGTVELTLESGTQTVGPGKAIFIPRGMPYGYRVIEGPNEVIAVFTPAKT